MLCELKVENLALIESLHLLFETEGNAGLVVMTGETGAGKSIMLRAIKLLTGERGQADWVRSGAEQCVVEALFEVAPAHREFLSLLAESGFGDDTAVVIKRIITAGGRSRLYVNGSLATAKVVRELTAFLLNVASQHDQQQLLHPGFHLDFIDILGDLTGARELMGDLHAGYTAKKKELAGLKKQEYEKEQRKDFLQYQLDEIREASLQPGEDEELAAERKRLKNGDALIQLSRESYGALSTRIMDELGVVRKNMEQIGMLDPDAMGMVEEVSGYIFQSEDIAARLREYCDSLESDPYRLEQVSERIDRIQGLKRKYGESIEQILAFGEEAAEELEELENLEIRLGALEQEVALLEQKVIDQAAELTGRRRETARLLEDSMERELASLAFDRASLEVRWEEGEKGVGDIGPSGWDRVEFFFSANPGEPAKPLVKVASGGELSRLMLAMKCLLARKDMVETVIFDEVDAGIGGEAAEAVARKIQELAGHHQVFCITHLPQIAARGTDHYSVRKTVNAGRTLTSITGLDEQQRENEVARMLAGDSATAETHAWARQLLRKSRSEWEKI